DPETGLVYNRNRYFSPGMGRFVSIDPAGMWLDSINAGNGYTFAGANWMSRGDSLGLQGSPTIRLPAIPPRRYPSMEGEPNPLSGKDDWVYPINDLARRWANKVVGGLPYHWIPGLIEDIEVFDDDLDLAKKCEDI